MPGQIFISYRRDDAAYVTGHINDRLCDEFGAESIFTDVDNIALGVDFRSVLDDKVGQCQILLAVIGDHWLTAKNHEGDLRLQNPADFVRIEIESALRRNIPVIPLLVAGTTMPTKDDLPESLQDLSFRNGTQIRPAPDFHADIDRLIHSLKKHLNTVSIATKDTDKDHAAVETERAEEQQQFLAETRPGRQQEEDQSGFSDTNVIPEDDERARKQIELTRRDMKRKRASFILWPLIAVLVLVVAGASWYIDFEYEKQFEAAITAMQGSAVDNKDGLKANAAAESQSEGVDFAAVQSAADSDANVESEAGPVTEAQGEAEAVAETRGETDTIAQTKAESDAIIEPQNEAEPLADTDGASEAQGNPDADAETEALGEITASAKARNEADIEARLSLDASAAFREGISLAALGNHKEAIPSYDEAIRLIEEPAFVYKQRGASYHALGDYDAAVKDYSEAIRLNAEDANAYYNRGVAYRELGDHIAAIENFDEAIRLDPEFAGAYDNRASSNEVLGNHDAAERDLALASEIRSGRIDRN